MYSIVIPCYKSSHTLKKLVTLTTEEMQKMNREDLEFVLVNDCSPDGGKTLEVLRQLAEENENVRVINLAKNVGQHNAMMAGLRYAKGDTIISMDDDMQTHPSQLPKMFAEYDKGYDVVYGYYPEKKHSLFRNFGSWFNRATVTLLLNKPKEIRSSSFWIMRKFVKDSIIEYTGAHTYLLGLILRTTNNIKSVEIQHFEREYGTSGYTLKSLLALWSNIIGFTAKPLEIAMHLGFLIAGFSFIAGIIIFVRKMIDPMVTIGWSSTIVAIFFSLGIILSFMGVIGEYIGRMYLQVNNEPQYVIRETVNIKENEKKSN